MREQLEEEHVAGIESALSATVAAAASAIRDGLSPDSAIREAGMEEAYRTLWEASYMRFAEETYDSIFRQTQGSQRSVKASEERIADWLRQVLAWMGRQGTTRIRQITETTRRMVRGVLRQALDEGLGTDEAAERLMDRWQEISRTRAERIVRTEIIGASNRGSQAGARSTGLKMEKVWLRASDDRVRRRPRDKFDHWQMQGQRRPLDEPYDVSGERMMHPGDPELGASAGNIIQCRCTEVYRVVR